jgi:hypothetical protein
MFVLGVDSGGIVATMADAALAGLPRIVRADDEVRWRGQVLTSLGLAALLAPMRFGWFLYRRGRNAVRQGRIDRCHCPNCGYNAKYSILRGRCPECGSELYERPEY